MLCPASVFLKSHTVPTSRRQASCTVPQSASNVWRDASTPALATTQAKQNTVTTTKAPQPRLVPVTASVPRPVTMGQLWRACRIASSPCTVQPRSSSEQMQPSMCKKEDDDGDMVCEGERVGESTIIVDAAACSLVLLCGRVLWRCGPEANGSLSTAHPYSLLVITDTTGMVGVVQYHSLHYYTSTNNDSGTEDAERDAGKLRGKQELEKDREGEETEVEIGKKTTCEHVDAAVAGQTEEEEGGGEDSAAAVQPDANHIPYVHETTNAPVCEDVTYIPDCETDIRVQDYVVCIGRLAFSDVDPDVRRYFAHVPAPSPTVRAATQEEAKRVTEAEEQQNVQAAQQTKPYVLLPGAPVAMRIEELRSVLGTCTSDNNNTSSDDEDESIQLPAGAIYMSEAEAQAHNESSATEQHRTTIETTITQQQRATQSSPAEGTAGLRLCVKGRVRLVTEMNEMLYWSLTAIQTHLRLSRQDRENLATRDDVMLDATGRLARVQVLQDVLRRTSLAELRDREIVEWLAEAERWLRDGADASSTRITNNIIGGGGGAEIRFLVLGVLHTMPWWRVVEAVEKASLTGSSKAQQPPPSAARAAVTRWHRRLQLGFERVCLALIEQSQHTVPDVLEVVMKPFRLQPPVRDGARRVIPCDSVVRLLNAVATRYSGLYVQDLLDQCLSTLIPRRRWPEARHHLACAAIFLHLALEGHVPGYDETLYVPDMEQLLQAVSRARSTTGTLDTHTTSNNTSAHGPEGWRLPPTATTMCSRIVPAVMTDGAASASRRGSVMHSARRSKQERDEGNAKERSMAASATNDGAVLQLQRTGPASTLITTTITATTTTSTRISTSASVAQTAQPPSMSDTDGNTTTTTTANAIAGIGTSADKQALPGGPTLNNRMLSYRDELIHFVLQWLLEKELTLERHDTEDSVLGLSGTLGASRSNSNASSPLGSSLLSRQSPHFWRTQDSNTKNTTTATTGVMRPARLVAMPASTAAIVTPPTTTLIALPSTATNSTSTALAQDTRAQFPSTPPPPPQQQQQQSQQPASHAVPSSPSDSQTESNAAAAVRAGHNNNDSVEEQFDEVARPFLRILQACTTLVFVKLAEDLRRQQTAGACGNADWWRELLAFHLGAVLRIERPVCLLYLAPSLALLGTQEESVDMMHKLVSLITKGYMPVTQKPSFAARSNRNGRMMTAMMGNVAAAAGGGGGGGSNSGAAAPGMLRMMNNNSSSSNSVAAAAGHHMQSGTSGSGGSSSNAQPVRMRMPPPMARAQSVSLPQRLRAALYLYPLFRFMRDRLGSAEGVRRRMLKWVAQEMRSYGVASRLVETLFAQCAAIAELLGLPLVAQPSHNTAAANDTTTTEATDTLADTLQPLIERYRLKSNILAMPGVATLAAEEEKTTDAMMHFDLQQMEFEGLLCPGLMDECPWDALLAVMRLDTIVSHLHDNDYVMVEKRGEVGILRMLVQHQHKTSNAECEDVCVATGSVLNAAMRHELLRGLRALEADPACAVIVLTSDSHTLFATGIVDDENNEEDDVHTNKTTAPTLAQLVIAVERCRKVVVALITGLCASGGLELVLAAAYRVATKGACFAFPEVHLSLVPRAGGVRRLVRLVGVRNALFMLTTGRCISLSEAKSMGLVDATVTMASSQPINADTVSSKDNNNNNNSNNNGYTMRATTPSAMMMMAAAANAVACAVDSVHTTHNHNDSTSNSNNTGSTNRGENSSDVVCGRNNNTTGEDVMKGVCDAGASVWALVGRLGRVGHPSWCALPTSHSPGSKESAMERAEDKVPTLEVSSPGTVLPCEAQLPLVPYGMPGSLRLPYYTALLAWVRRQWRQHVPRHGPQGVLHAARAVELALRNAHEPAKAMAHDEALYRHCRAQPEAAALRHLLRATEALARRSATIANATTHTNVAHEQQQQQHTYNVVRHVVLVGADELSVQLALLLLLLLLPPPCEKAANNTSPRVTLVTLDAGQVVRVRARIAHCLQHALRCPAAVCAQALAHLTVVADLTQVECAPCGRSSNSSGGVHVLDADVVIECAEAASLPARKQLLARLDGMCGRGAIFLTTATNQCALHELAACTTRPSRVLGVHFYAPVLESALVEVITDTNNNNTMNDSGAAEGGLLGAQDVLPRVMQLLRRVHKPAVVRSTAGRCTGVRLLLAGLYQVYAILEEGCYPHEVDRTLRRIGHFQLGLLELADATGLTALAHAEHASHPPSPPSPLLCRDNKTQISNCNDNVVSKDVLPRRAVYDVVDRLIGAGHTGRTAGEGWYKYRPALHGAMAVHLGWRGWNAMLWDCGLVSKTSSDRNVCPGLAAPYAKPNYNADVDAALRACSAAKHMMRRELAASEVVERVVLAMANEAARVLAEGAVARAAELDCVSVLGLGFPAFRGGLCYDADAQYNNTKNNSASLVHQMQLYHWSLGPDTFPAPCAALLKMQRTGGSFATMFAST